MTRFMVVFYGGMTLAGAGLAYWIGQYRYFDPFSLPGENWILAGPVTILLVGVTHVFSRVWLAKSGAGRATARDVVDILGPITPGKAGFIAAASAIGEEWFFRGFLLNAIGLFWSSLLFAAVHFPFNRRWKWWPVFALIMGLVAALLCWWTKTLLWAIILHAGINFLNLWHLGSIASSEQIKSNAFRPPPSNPAR